jgi:hypothetical protein
MYHILVLLLGGLALTPSRVNMAAVEFPGA